MTDPTPLECAEDLEDRANRSDDVVQMARQLGDDLPLIDYSNGILRAAAHHLRAYAKLAVKHERLARAAEQAGRAIRAALTDVEDRRETRQELRSALAALREAQK